MHVHDTRHITTQSHTDTMTALACAGGQRDDEELEEDHQGGCHWRLRHDRQPPALHVSVITAVQQLCVKKVISGCAHDYVI